MHALADLVVDLSVERRGLAAVQEAQPQDLPRGIGGDALDPGVLADVEAIAVTAEEELVHEGPWKLEEVQVDRIRAEDRATTGRIVLVEVQGLIVLEQVSADPGRQPVRVVGQLELVGGVVDLLVDGGPQVLEGQTVVRRQKGILGASDHRRGIRVQGADAGGVLPGHDVT